MHILIVDDVALNRRLLGAILEAEGHRVIEAADGLEALSILDGELVDAIISDILMPRMDGYRFCYEVRSNERFRHLPFLFYTSTYTSPSDEKLALDMGSDKFLTKPAASAEILEALREATTTHRRPFTATEPERELNLMREYNQQLVIKLEEKNSELTKRNKELNAMHARIQHLLEHSPAVLYQLKVKGQTIIPVVMSENIQTLLGFTAPEACNFEWWLNGVHPEDRDRTLEAFARGMSQGFCSMEYRIRHRDLSYRWIVDNNRVVSGAGQEFADVVGVWTDITERKLNEQKNEEQLHELRRWRELTLGREDRIHALKIEVNEALEQAGKPARYAAQPEN